MVRNAALLTALTTVLCGSAKVRADATGLPPTTLAPGWRYGIGAYFGGATGQGDGGARLAMGLSGEAVYSVGGTAVNLSLPSRVQLEAGPWSYTEADYRDRGTALVLSVTEGVKPCLVGVLCLEAAVGARLTKDGDLAAEVFGQGRISVQVPFLARGGGELGLSADLGRSTQQTREAEGVVFINAFWR
jgi:hypothetical protein